MEIVINRCYGGFGLSPAATRAYLEAKGKSAFFYQSGRNFRRMSADEASELGYFHVTTHDFGEYPEGIYPVDGESVNFYDRSLPRDDPDLIRIVRELGPLANAAHANLKIVEIPDEIIAWEIDEDDGMEKVVELRREWY